MNEFIIVTKSGMKKIINGVLKTGVCVVAYDVQQNRLVRFVQEPDGAPISGLCTRSFNVLDRVDVDIIKPLPEGPQVENVLVRTNSLKGLGPGSLNIYEIYERLGHQRNLSFMNSSWFSFDSVNQYNCSIRIVHVTNIVCSQEKDHGPRVSFDLNGRHHQWVRVTDKDFFISKHVTEQGQIHLDEAIFAISIPSIPYETDGRYYKFVAAIYTPNQWKESDHEDELPF